MGQDVSLKSEMKKPYRRVFLFHLNLVTDRTKIQDIQEGLSHQNFEKETPYDKETQKHSQLGLDWPFVIASREANYKVGKVGSNLWSLFLHFLHY